MIAFCYKMIHKDSSFDFGLGLCLFLAPIFMVWELIIEAFNIFLKKFFDDDPEKQTKIYMISTYSLASIMIILGIASSVTLADVAENSFDFLVFCGIWITVLPFGGLMYNLFKRYKDKKNDGVSSSKNEVRLPPPPPADAVGNNTGGIYA